MKPPILLVLAAFATHAAAVPLCLSKLTITESSTILRAQAIVTRVFADAGVRVEWLNDRQCRSASTRAVFVMLEAGRPSQFGAGTLGYAQPYSSGTAVHIFYDRIRLDHPGDFFSVLGHAMAHEIAHVLQGIDRHSGTGIMKAVWGFREYGDMHLGQLKFSEEDVELLQLGLKNLEAGSFAARF